MTDLRLVGLSEDGTRLVLETTDGTEFTVLVDERVHAALRGDRARLGQLQINLESQLRPREIQARIRAGQTAEEVAEVAGVPPERVRRFEGPILLERAHMAESARGVGVRRVTDSTTTPLGTLVEHRLAEAGVDPEELTWDSWRREDGRWEVQLGYAAEGRERSARWLFDPERRTVEPDDDEARRLTDEERAVPAAPPSRRLAPVPDQADTAPVPAAPPAAEAETVEPVPEPALEPAPEPAPAGSSRRSKRSSVPSWDEILFGGPRREE